MMLRTEWTQRQRRYVCWWMKPLAMEIHLCLVNELKKVRQDNRGAIMQLEQVERELIAYCRAQAGIDDGNNAVQIEDEPH
jgi:hypothetical protein